MNNNRINLRRPDIMKDVQLQVETHYRSSLVQRIRANGSVINMPGLTIKLAKEFGFCYGVERAINLAYAARQLFANQPIYILGEIIHNPEVNEHLKQMGIQFLSGAEKTADISDLKHHHTLYVHRCRHLHHGLRRHVALLHPSA